MSSRLESRTDTHYGLILLLEFRNTNADIDEGLATNSSVPGTDEVPITDSSSPTSREEQYQHYGGDAQDWTWKELEYGLRSLLSDTSKCFAFLIDGLDEDESDSEQGDSETLINLILSLAGGKTNVKMCLASGPWLVFEEAFRHKPWLRLEELTINDIHLYVTEKIQASKMFPTLQRCRPESATDLINETCNRSSRVFLWVYIVVASLLQGLMDGDTIKDLQARLTGLPTDLGELFRRILNRLKPHHFIEASKLFQIVKAADRPLSLLSISLDQDDLERAMAANIEVFTTADRGLWTEETRRRLQSRCHGLLEASNWQNHGAEARVQYLHRTVRDFFGRKKIWQYIVSSTQAETSFRPSLAICGSFLAQLKAVTISGRVGARFWSTLRNCISYSRLVGLEDQALQCRVIQSLETVSEQVWKEGIINLQLDSTNHWIESLGEQPPETLVLDPQAALCKEWCVKGFIENFFQYAFAMGLNSYTSGNLTVGSPELATSKGRLQSAVSAHNIALESVLARVRDTHAARPGLSDGVQTAWASQLDSSELSTSCRGRPDYDDIIEILLPYNRGYLIRADGSQFATCNVAQIQEFVRIILASGDRIRGATLLAALMPKSSKIDRAFRWFESGNKKTWYRYLASLDSKKRAREGHSLPIRKRINLDANSGQE